jgi:hypothetical protein
MGNSRYHHTLSSPNFIVLINQTTHQPIRSNVVKINLWPFDDM